MTDLDADKHGGPFISGLLDTDGLEPDDLPFAMPDGIISFLGSVWTGELDDYAMVDMKVALDGCSIEAALPIEMAEDMFVALGRAIAAAKAMKQGEEGGDGAKTPPLAIKLDGAPLTAALDRLVRALPDLTEAGEETLHGFLSRLETGDEVLFVQADVPCASAAREAVVRLDPSDSLLRLLSAVGAGDV
ncbi:hypothetical protein LV780_04785 [Cereibacter azotoformans]|uniref:hypothetical protein n=1 Tax=Cereibacter azotoformans TaxID=43057 RepID=UPI0015F3357A|nr:hypothetical protein [Cereibacter azotoformans]UIJ31496.1 hypothetical protein LV780_04785 [Cereibacter azotoformans]